MAPKHGGQQLTERAELLGRAVTDQPRKAWYRAGSRCSCSVASRKLTSAGRRWAISAPWSQLEKFRPENRRSTVYKHPPALAGVDDQWQLDADIDATPALVQLQELYESWRGIDIGIELPLIIDTGERGGRFYTVDRRFSGRNFSSWLQGADMAQRRPALVSFLDATEQLQRLPARYQALRG